MDTSGPYLPLYRLYECQGRRRAGRSGHFSGAKIPRRSLKNMTQGDNFFLTTRLGEHRIQLSGRTVRCRAIFHNGVLLTAHGRQGASQGAHLRAPGRVFRSGAAAVLICLPPLDFPGALALGSRLPEKVLLRSFGRVYDGDGLPSSMRRPAVDAELAA